MSHLNFQTYFLCSSAYLISVLVWALKTTQGKIKNMRCWYFYQEYVCISIYVIICPLASTFLYVLWLFILFSAFHSIYLFIVKIQVKNNRTV